MIHSSAFRRLEGKTQVFAYHEGRNYRTRLTHSIEVAQITRTLCKNLNLNEELGEAIDMIKDLSEAIYYCTIVESMEGLEEDKEIRTSVNNITYYTNPKESKYRDMERASGYMYYPTSYSGENGWPSDMDGSSVMGRGGRAMYYTPAMADMARDPR